LLEKEIERLERGEAGPSGDQLLERSNFKPALAVVSEARLVQTIYAEYPDLKAVLEELEGEKTEQTAQSLAAIWKTSDQETASRIQSLVEVGFFQQRGSRDNWTYWVPFLYRDALTMSQGIADEI
jgi:Fic family protein